MNDIKCNYIRCYAGMGVAGMKRCILGGDYTNKNCENFREENDELLKHAEEEISRLKKQNKELEEEYTTLKLQNKVLRDEILK